MNSAALTVHHIVLHVSNFIDKKVFIFTVKENGLYSTNWNILVAGTDIRVGSFVQ